MILTPAQIAEAITNLLDTIDALQMDLSVAFASERIVASLSKDPNEGLLEYLKFLQRLKVSEKLSIPEHLKPDAILSSISPLPAEERRTGERRKGGYVPNNQMRRLNTERRSPSGQD